METIIVKDKITKGELENLAHKQYGDVIKAVVDVKKEIMAVGGELHADEEALLLQNGSRQENLWGMNIYPNNPEENRIEFDSVINIRPSQNNKSRSVESLDIQRKIRDIVNRLIL